MIPEQLTQQLLDRFWNLNPQFKMGTGEKDYLLSKAISNFVVDEIIKELQHVRNTYHIKEIDRFELKYWNNIKQQLNGTTKNNSIKNT